MMSKESTVPALDLDQENPTEQTIEEIVASVSYTHLTLPTIYSV